MYVCPLRQWNSPTQCWVNQYGTAVQFSFNQMGHIVTVPTQYCSAPVQCSLRLWSTSVLMTRYSRDYGLGHQSCNDQMLSCQQADDQSGKEQMMSYHHPHDQRLESMETIAQII